MQEHDQSTRNIGTLAETLLSAIPFGMGIVDEDLNLLYVNPRIENRVGEGVVGKKCYQVYRDDGTQCSGCPLHGRGSASESLEVQGMFGGRTMQITHASVDLAGKQVLLEVLQDITERKQTEETIRQTVEKLKLTSEKTVGALAGLVERMDPYIAGHQHRVALLASAIAREMGLPEGQIEGIRVAGTLHDIGKIDMPSSIVNKRAKLSDIEMAIVQTHPRVGYEIVKKIPFAQPVAEFILQHHERMDGSGYPRALIGEAILPEARIMAVADVVEAIVSPRPHRPDLGAVEILDEILKNRGTLYDSSVVDAYLRLFPEKDS